MHRYTIAKQQPHCYNYSEAAELVILEADNKLNKKGDGEETSEYSPAQIAEEFFLLPRLHVTIRFHEEPPSQLGNRAKQMDRSPAPLTLGSSITELRPR